MAIIKDIVRHKSTQYQKISVYLSLSVYISRDFSSLVAIIIIIIIIMTLQNVYKE